MRRGALAVGTLAVGAVAAVAAVRGAQAPTRAAPTAWLAPAPPPPPPRPAAPPPAAITGTDAPSNVTDADYVGPATCVRCHAEQAAGWRAGLHVTMTQAATRAAVRGAFDGRTLAYGGGRVRFAWRDDHPVMEMVDAGGAARRFRVTRTIGSRALQEYVGVLEGDAAAVEVRLPFGWWRARADWYPQPYYDSWFDDEYAAGAPAFDAFAPPTEAWADRCAWCHNTYPFALRAARPDVGVGPERDLAPMPPLITDNHLPIERLVTVGISCESCHFGGRAHAADPDATPPVFAPRGPTVVAAGSALPPADRDDPRTTTAICAQCHSTPSPRFPDGSAARNSSEALALAAGACASAIRCVDCHEPHTPGPPSGGPDQPAHVAACARCHGDLADPAAARAHARHDPAAASCLDCHMPRLVQGVGTYVRSHRISSPTDARMLAAGAPNACNLCHLDRSIAWTARALAAWGKRRTPTAAWRDAYGGDLDYAVGPAWLTHREPYVRMTAAAAYARAGDRAALPRLVEALDDPRANTRMWMLLAIEALAGRRLRADSYDPLAPPTARAAQLPALRRWAAAEARASARRAR
ncbi:MAG: ammonia-forming cytochrome c nitrite reductase subunit c552 [Myxococcales bacterium]|nr:ammonia-forming cytochrome c nitrite reductase subunit c552 [Myxococcales bacterium]MBK7195930.1 ammonia-forming cytochrome c nitrite reductase subunit c552 [Myxococcales bacterium]MBP6843184.1 ammonia-forming cytochrome c nitrite reductase subunit c552 [Kofleriaceae bacterium]